MTHIERKPLVLVTGGTGFVGIECILHLKPSDIYLDLGFEDLSHFSFAFKKQFGFAPKQLVAPQTDPLNTSN